MRFFLFIFSLLLLSATSIGFAQEAVPTTLPYEDFFEFLFHSIGGFNGASSLGVAVLLAQILTKLFETKVVELIGKWKLTIIAFLTLFAGTVGMSLSTNVSIVTAMFSSANLVLLQGFIHQVYKQFFKKED